MNNIYIQTAHIGPGVSDPVLATVTGSKGSTPQKPGSSALFGNKRLILGTVGGGIVENKVSDCAEKCSQTKGSAYLHFSLDNDISRKEEAICGGNISILLDADPLSHISVYKEMEQSLASGYPGVLITVVTMLNEPGVSIARHWMTAGREQSLPGNLRDKIAMEATNLLSSPSGAGFCQFELSLPEEEKTSLVFLETIFPLPRLVIAGAGHIGKSLLHLGKMLDFEVTVADSREEYANPGKLPDADHIIVGDIGKTLESIKKDKDTYIVIVTHGHADDARALRPCIGSASAYVGMIGSKGKIAKMHEEFIRQEWANEEEWKRIFSPIGLDIGSKTVEEIAVSIAAQLILVRRQNPIG